MFGSEALEIGIGSRSCVSVSEPYLQWRHGGNRSLVKWGAKGLERGIRELLNDPDGASVTKLFAHLLTNSLFAGEYDPAYLKRTTALTGLGRQMDMRLSEAPQSALRYPAGEISPRRSST